MTKVSLHRFAKLPQRFLLAFGLGLGILTIGAIAPPPSMTEETTTPTAIAVTPYFTDLPAALASANSLWLTAPTALPALLSVTLYTPTPDCETYTGEPSTVTQDKAVAQVVHHLIAQQTPQLLDFELAGYRLLPGPEGHTVTIDFRRQANAQRHFISLSICERRMLLGSLRETLLQNSALGIKAVEFTEQGRPIL